MTKDFPWMREQKKNRGQDNHFILSSLIQALESHLFMNAGLGVDKTKQSLGLATGSLQRTTEESSEMAKGKMIVLGVVVILSIPQFSFCRDPGLILVMRRD